MACRVYMRADMPKGRIRGTYSTLGRALTSAKRSSRSGGSATVFVECSKGTTYVARCYDGYCKLSKGIAPVFRSKPKRRRR